MEGSKEDGLRNFLVCCNGFLPSAVESWMKDLERYILVGQSFNNAKSSGLGMQSGWEGRWSGSEGVWIQIIECRPQLCSGEELDCTKSPRRQKKNP